uniref:Uncharacterized protein n=1 Tax=Arundo donax TaxID=35708 RepID=A0A0A9HNU6_ARUDO
MISPGHENLLMNYDQSAPSTNKSTPFLFNKRLLLILISLLQENLLTAGKVESRKKEVDNREHIPIAAGWLQ